MGQGAQVYEVAAAGGPLMYFGYSGYEQSGMERSAAVTVNVFSRHLPPLDPAHQIAESLILIRDRGRRDGRPAPSTP